MSTFNLPTHEQQQQALTLLQELGVDIDTLLAGRVVKSVQRGTISGIKPTTAGVVSRQITISPVNISKCDVSINAYKSTANDNSNGFTYEFVNNSTLVFESFMSDLSTAKLSWQVIEYY